ncbi:DNA polymerase I [Prochlorococcus marinus str. NATL1A]|uniref:DNA polymerase I n=1 Tax=Prochlorococcus marinus (strain NATL1A) TaxID=167555 RepID=A2C3T5_PROM1|nr:DNA polymerase I [Prochlorococcus marinus]ABM76145.1 DNA polymerase I [Prochlorococcus marinus str. NATL1A]
MTEIKKPTLLLVDGHSLAFRSFYAFSKGGEGGLTTKDGFPTSVTYGFLKSLLDNCKSIEPKGVTIAFDTAEPTFRHKEDPNYKANRDVAPDIFFQDLDQLEEILKESLNLSICKAPGYEADDVLGTLANDAAEKGWSVRILSGDRDLFQLVDDERDIAVLYMGGGPYAKSGSPKLINEKGVREKLGVNPNKVIDLKALTGDSSDNIPGVKGVGPKTAINLLNENLDLDGVYKSLQELEKEGEKAKRGAIKGAVRLKLKADKDNAYLSKKLAEILIKIPIDPKVNYNLEGINESKLAENLERLELHSLSKQVSTFKAIFSKDGSSKKDLNPSSKEINIANNKTKNSEFSTLNETKEIPRIEPKIINNLEELNNFVAQIIKHTDAKKPIAIDTETTSLNPFKAELVGLGFCFGESLKDIVYIPIGHKNKEDDLIEINQINQLKIEEVIFALQDWFSSNENPKTLQNAKYDRLILLRHGIILNGVVMDTLLADYICDATLKHSLDEIAYREFGFKPKSFSDIVKKGEDFSYVDIKSASMYCGMDVYLTRKLAIIYINRLKETSIKLINLLKEVEQPLEQVLAEIESTGIIIDTPYLKDLSLELTKRLNTIEKEVYNIAGSEFNLSSPKQLGELLFEKLDLDRKKSRKTKTGWSTDVAVLEKLESDHPIVKIIIEHRTISKLLNTYVDALPKLIEKETGRVHTDFNQAVTATGRLSSSNPNLQNIPVRTEFSRRIRKAFLPQKDWKLLSADYSQIELRILTHLSGEEVLKNAYLKNEDVHSLTAKILFEKDAIDADERRIGKTINFGVIYGMGAQRFARSTGVSLIEAKYFLSKFKERYPAVFKFLEYQERLALSQGFVETLLGRRRYFHFNKNGLGRLLGTPPNEIDLTTARRAGMEAQQLRAAANAPIQGSSADIIKLAMIQLHSALRETGLAAKILLQVHDELVLEVNPKDLEETKLLVQNTMENAVKLSVPLIVETGVGVNWMEAK